MHAASRYNWRSGCSAFGQQKSVIIFFRSIASTHASPVSLRCRCSAATGRFPRSRSLYSTGCQPHHSARGTIAAWVRGGMHNIRHVSFKCEGGTGDLDLARLFAAQAMDPGPPTSGMQDQRPPDVRKDVHRAHSGTMVHLCGLVLIAGLPFMLDVWN